MRQLHLLQTLHSKCSCSLIFFPNSIYEQKFFLKRNAKKFYRCHVSTAVVTCAKFHGDDSRIISVRAKGIVWSFKIMGMLKLMKFALCLALGWGLPKLCSLISPQAKFFIQKWLSNSLNHIHIWQVSPQLSCAHTCHIWTWSSIANTCSNNSGKFEKYNGTKEIGLVTPTPEPISWFIGLGLFGLSSWGQ